MGHYSVASRKHNVRSSIYLCRSLFFCRYPRSRFLTV